VRERARGPEDESPLFALIGLTPNRPTCKSTSYAAREGPGTGAAAPWVLAAIGIVMTIVMQSSTAAAATTLVALDAGSLNFEQDCTLVVGQSVGT
jgi:phosphate:Na+ symporter